MSYTLLLFSYLSCGIHSHILHHIAQHVKLSSKEFRNNVSLLLEAAL